MYAGECGVCVCLWCMHTCTCAHAPTQRAEDDMECFSVTLCFMGPRLSLNQKLGWWWGNPSNLPVFTPRWYRHQHSHTRHPSWCWKACPASVLSHWVTSPALVFLWTFFYCYCCLFWDRVSLWSPIWPGTRFIDHAGLELIRDFPASASTNGWDQGRESHLA